MASNSPAAVPIEQDFHALCDALEGMPEDKMALFLAKLALVLCNLIDDRASVKDAIERAKLNLDGPPAA